MTRPCDVCRAPVESGRNGRRLRHIVPCAGLARRVRYDPAVVKVNRRMFLAGVFVRRG